MKRDNKKALYESIMTSVAKEVKKALDEEYKGYVDYSEDELDNDEDHFIESRSTVGRLIDALKRYPLNYTVASWDDVANRYRGILVTRDENKNHSVLIQLD